MKDFAFKGYNVIFIIAKWLKKTWCLIYSIHKLTWLSVQAALIQQHDFSSPSSLFTQQHLGVISPGGDAPKC